MAATSNTFTLGVTTKGQLVRKLNGQKAKWAILGKANMVDVAVNNKGQICAVNGGKNIYCRGIKSAWKRVAGKASSVTINNRKMVVVNKG